MYIDKIIKKEVVTLIISVGLLLIVFIGVSFASFFKIDEGKDNVVETGNLAISFCSDSTCDTTYENIGQVIGTTKQNGTSVPSSIYPYPNDGTYSNATPYIFKVTNTGSMKATITIKLKEDSDFLPSGNYSEYNRLTDLYANHLKIAIRKKVLASGLEYQMGDVNMDGIVNQKDAALILNSAAQLETLTTEQKKLADINGDNIISANDSGIILQMLGGNDTVLEMTYINLFSELYSSIIYAGDIIEPGESATYFLWLYLDETTPNQAQKTYFVGNLDIQGEFIPDNIPFSEASWSTIITNVKAGNGSKYKVGDTKEIDMGTYGTHTLRVANTSTPSECSTTGFSQTACGFVLEFADIITTHEMNNTPINVGGWPASSLYTFVNNDIYNAIPDEIKNAIIDTTVVSGHGKNDTENFTSTDKLYLLTPKEIYTGFSSSYDAAKDLTRTLDYYINQGVTTSNYSGAIKKNETRASYWWLRTARSAITDSFFTVGSYGNWYIHTTDQTHGVAPAFRLG